MCRNWGSEKLSDLPKDTQLVRVAKPRLEFYFSNFFQFPTILLLPPYHTTLLRLFNNNNLLSFINAKTTARHHAKLSAQIISFIIHGNSKS